MCARGFRRGHRFVLIALVTRRRRLGQGIGDVMATVTIHAREGAASIKMDLDSSPRVSDLSKLCRPHSWTCWIPSGLRLPVVVLCFSGCLA